MIGKLSLRADHGDAVVRMTPDRLSLLGKTVLLTDGEHLTVQADGELCLPDGGFRRILQGTTYRVASFDEVQEEV